MKGIYIIEFLIYPGVYKIGRSKNIENRFKQFKGNTAILGDVSLLYYKEFSNEKVAEKSIHQILKDFRVQNNREFFKGDLEYFKKVLDYVYEKEKTYDYSKFFYTLIDEESPLKMLCSGVLQNILTWLCCNMKVNTNTVYLTTDLRKQLCRELDISNDQISNGLNKLSKFKYIYKEGRSIIVHPIYFWKGPLTERTKIIRSKKIQMLFNFKLV